MQGDPTVVMTVVHRLFVFRQRQEGNPECCSSKHSGWSQDQCLYPPPAGAHSRILALPGWLPGFGSPPQEPLKNRHFSGRLASPGEHPILNTAQDWWQEVGKGSGRCFRHWKNNSDVRELVRLLSFILGSWRFGRPRYSSSDTERDKKSVDIDVEREISRKGNIQGDNRSQTFGKLYFGVYVCVFRSQKWIFFFSSLFRERKWSLEPIPFLFGTLWSSKRYKIVSEILKISVFPNVWQKCPPNIRFLERNRNKCSLVRCINSTSSFIESHLYQIAEYVHDILLVAVVANISGVFYTPPLIKNLILDKISDETNLKISNVLKRPKMWFSVPKAPIFWNSEINKNLLVNDNLSTREDYKKNTADFMWYSIVLLWELIQHSPPVIWCSNSEPAAALLTFVALLIVSISVETQSVFYVGIHGIPTFGSDENCKFCVKK